MTSDIPKLDFPALFERLFNFLLVILSILANIEEILFDLPICYFFQLKLFLFSKLNYRNCCLDHQWYIVIILPVLFTMSANASIQNFGKCQDSRCRQMPAFKISANAKIHDVGKKFRQMPRFTVSANASIHGFH